MKRSTFDGIVKIIELGRGPKIKPETIDGAFKVLSNPLGKGHGRYDKRLAFRAVSVAMDLAERDESHKTSFELLMKLNVIKPSEATEAVQMSIDKGCTLSAASVTLGAYSAQVYKMKQALDTFHKIRIGLEF